MTGAYNRTETVSQEAESDGSQSKPGIDCEQDDRRLQPHRNGVAGGIGRNAIRNRG
jgi:hypothetical protein